MQIILLEPVKNLGTVGDVVTVKNGYARNFLIPNRKAMRATADNVAYFDAKKKEIQAANQEKVSAANTTAKKIAGTVVALVQQAGEDGRLYGSVNATDIAAALSKHAGVEISRKQIVLHSPIKYVGIHTVEIDLHGDVVTTIHPNIARSEADAKSAAERFARGEKVMEGPEADSARKQAELEAASAAVKTTAKAESTKEEDV
jgi:large subunit ribosomal protein L9